MGKWENYFVLVYKVKRGNLVYISVVVVIVVAWCIFGVMGEIF